jgi:outer membrane protein OmpA-like peptidoglycan-associated protein
MRRTVITAFIATGLGVLALSGCGSRDSAPVESASTPSAPAAPEPPPPTFAAQAEMALNDLGGKITDKGYVVTLGAADFPAGKADFQPESTERMDRVAELLKEREELRLEILGFTDNRGSAKANERLSQQRADAVKQAFVARGNLDESRITAKGMGKADPVAPNDTEEGRAQNRRVELRLVDENGGYSTRIGLGPGGAALPTP